MPRRGGTFRRSYRPTHYWTTVNQMLHCQLGNHSCRPGTRGRIRIDDPFRRFSCADCLKPAGIEEPAPKPRKVVMNFDEDVRARQAGGDE